MFIAGKMRSFGLLLCAVAMSTALPPDSLKIPEDSQRDGRSVESYQNGGKLIFKPTSASDIMKKVIAKGCSESYTFTCLKLDAINFLDRISEQDSYEILYNVMVVKSGDNVTEGRSSDKLPQELLSSLARDASDSEDRLNEFLLGKLSHYLTTHAIKIPLLEENAVETPKGFGDKGGKGGGFEGGRKKDKGGMGMMMMMGMMKAMMGAMAMAGVAALAGKALMVGLMALTLAAVAGLKSLSSGGGKGSVTYEIVSKPHYTHSHHQTHSHEFAHGHSGHGGGGGGGYGDSYGRSLKDVDAHTMAFGGQMPEYAPQGSR